MSQTAVFAIVVLALVASIGAIIFSVLQSSKAEANIAQLRQAVAQLTPQGYAQLQQAVSQLQSSVSVLNQDNAAMQKTVTTVQQTVDGISYPVQTIADITTIGDFQSCLEGTTPCPFPQLILSNASNSTSSATFPVQGGAKYRITQIIYIKSDQAPATPQGVFGVDLSFDDYNYGIPLVYVPESLCASRTPISFATDIIVTAPADATNFSYNFWGVGCNLGTAVCAIPNAFYQQIE